MHDFVIRIREQTVPFFDRTRDIGSLMSNLMTERWGSEHHRLLEVGTYAAHVEEWDLARSALERAIEEYHNDGRDWVGGYIDIAEQLLSAIRDGSVRQVLDRWEAHSVEHLGIGKLLRRMP